MQMQAANCCCEFQSTPPARGATAIPVSLRLRHCHFNPRPPRGGRHRRGAAPHRRQDFNPRPPRGGRPQCATTSIPTVRFQSTPPARGATGKALAQFHRLVISIHAPREGGDDPFFRSCGGLDISIHAPREGGDLSRISFVRPDGDFNPRPPRGGRRENIRRRFRWLIFQSTPPARGATLINALRYYRHHHFNPRPPRGGRRRRCRRS